jgi:hypothetical protein
MQGQSGGYGQQANWRCRSEAGEHPLNDRGIVNRRDQPHPPCTAPPMSSSEDAWRPGLLRRVFPLPCPDLSPREAPRGERRRSSPARAWSPSDDVKAMTFHSSSSDRRPFQLGMAKIVATIPGDQAFRPLAEGGWPLVKK